VAQPAPTLAFSAEPITAHNPGRLVKMPDPKPLDVTQRYGEAASVSFTDELNGQTTYFYHVQLKGLRPGTRYYYQVADGASEPSTAGSSFETAPSGRAKFRFSSYGDLATPSWDLNTSGNIWHESCDNSWYAVTAIENPGDGKGAPLFHLLNGDLCYANLDVDNAPGVWRDFGDNVARSAANRPWMPALGNHECEFGTDTISGHPGKAPGGIAAQGAAGNYWNGPYGFGHYLSRFLLPDNGVTNWDGNRLRGNFYAFQVGTVTFISLDADDVIYQDGAANYVINTANTPPRLDRGRALVRRHQPDRRVRLLDLRRRPWPASRGNHDHLPVLRDPGGDQRGRLRARRHHHAADAAHREVRLRPPGGPPVAQSRLPLTAATGAQALDHLPGRRVLGLGGPGMAESDLGAPLTLVAQ
jgi:hypothetical protein